MAAKNRLSALALAIEYFSAEDGRFVETLREVTRARPLATFADQWKKDPRPWAREQVFAYLDGSPDCVGHQPVVKRLFKQAEENGDDELVAAFAVLFDRLVRHEQKTRVGYDGQSQSRWEEEYLVAAGEGMQFRYPTRYYLQRRAWRYFRHLGFRDPRRYIKATAYLLASYEDEHLARGENLLDSWTLLHAAFRQSGALDFGRERIVVTEGHSLGSLRAAPRFVEHWQSKVAFGLLVDLLTTARSRLVRVWATQLLEDEHAERLANLPVEKLLALLGSKEGDIQQFAGRLLKKCRELGQVPLATWRELLETDSPAVLEAACDAMRHHVAHGEWSLSDCVELALREPATVAQLGLDWLREKEIATPDDWQQVVRLAEPRCNALAGALADWAIRALASREYYDRDEVLPFFDSLVPAVREQAWEWLEAESCPGRDDPVFFCRLMETPYDDVRLRLIHLLEQRLLPGESKRGLAVVWTSVLLGVERGGRQKLQATGQIADAIVADPSLADSLLPVLAVAVRSVRKPESRSGIAAVVGLLARAPGTADVVARHLPELELVEAEDPA